MDERVIRFCENYLVHLNGAKAARDAGFEANRSRVTACELMRRDDVKQYIAERREQLMEAIGISQERILQEYARIAFSDIRTLYDNGALKQVHELDDDTAATIAGVETYEERNPEGGIIGHTKKVKLWDKVKALDALGKHLGMFKNIHELTGKNGEPLSAPIFTLQIPEGLELNLPNNTEADGDEGG